MNLNNLIKKLIQVAEKNSNEQLLLYMCYKFSNQIKLVESNNEYLPLLYIKGSKITLFYNEPEVDEFEYIFSDYEDIIIILQRIFNENKNLYFYYEKIEDNLSHEELIKKAREALSNDDEDGFQYYTTKLRED